MGSSLTLCNETCGVKCTDGVDNDYGLQRGHIALQPVLLSVCVNDIGVVVAEHMAYLRGGGRSEKSRIVKEKPLLPLSSLVRVCRALEVAAKCRAGAIIMIGGPHEQNAKAHECEAQGFACDVRVQHIA